VLRRQFQRPWRRGVGPRLKLMTHRGHFDSKGNQDPDGAIYEALSLQGPEVTKEHYA